MMRFDIEEYSSWREISTRTCLAAFYFDEIKFSVYLHWEKWILFDTTGKKLVEK